MNSLRIVRYQKGWTQQQLADFSGLSRSTIERAERGEEIRVDSVHRLCKCLGKTPSELGLSKGKNDQFKNDSQTPIEETTTIFTTNKNMSSSELWHDNLISQGITALQDLYFSGQPHQVEAILPLYCKQTATLSQHSSPIQKEAARLASLAQLLSSELFADRENFGEAEKAGKRAFIYGEIANDTNLQVAALISLGNIAFHRKLSTIALHVFKKAIAILDKASPLIKGRTYAGIAEVYAMRGEYQESMHALGRAYEHFPTEPEKDPAYQYLRASRYALYVFGDAQSHLFLNKPKQAEKALISMKQETNDPEIEPITKLDMLYYQAEVYSQQKELDQSIETLTKAVTLARDLGSRLYFDKLVHNYDTLKLIYPKDKHLSELEELFQSW
ncbi:helix-turn-helix transcriptional regulator [Hazenella sp. IB182357]|uniref:Helix-turn-helix transcriptional regulator n=1 Tax=Polycladospora coralii TaxID=2771432 RepID=A0A926N918_9BACL|nr:helix-turn-helix transcriptional regulator [Polycladospora coralii]MBD1371948.1 helix-turn-helix transcriptional regulator [Polycladospora coralii]